MIRVKNRKIIKELARESLKATKTRNGIAVLAIILTTVLFTSLFTIAAIVNYSTEQAVFRQVGGDFHGTFKDITKDVLEELKEDSLIKESGMRQFLGMATGEGFHKTQTEVSYMDLVRAKGSFVVPKQGRLPKEHTNELACDTKVLEILGVKPEVGAEITLTYNLGGLEGEKQKVTDTFVLCGWWEFDEVSIANNILLPYSYVQEKVKDYVPLNEYDITGKYDLDVYLKNAKHIKKDLEKIAKNHGYQTKDADKENYINIGVNWGYTQVQMNERIDPQTIVAIGAMLFVFLLTGYLIIYNIFQISVAGDIQFYGLLKTIGTTKRQIKGIIYQQGLCLSAIAIPIGLILGYICGNVLAPVVMSTYTYKEVHATANPLIFIGSALFSFMTVMLSCRKPGKIAGKVSPIEAVKYIEEAGRKKRKSKKSKRRTREKYTPVDMAYSNLGRNKKKTFLVVFSLSLMVVVLHVVVSITNGLSMDKFLKNLVLSDYVVAKAEYFRYSWGFSKDSPVEESVIEEIGKQGEITEEGRVYGTSKAIRTEVPETWYRNYYGKYESEQELEEQINNMTVDGKLMDVIQLYGMEEFPLSKLQVIDGDLSKLQDGTGNYILAVYATDDYDQVDKQSGWLSPGDTVTLQYETWEFYDEKTGEVIPQDEVGEENYEKINDMELRIQDSWEKAYEVAATVALPYAMSYRYVTSSEFILPAEKFKKDTRTDTTMLYMYNTPENDKMDAFLKEYTGETDTSLDYDSREKYEKQFKNYRNMFAIIGGVLCIVVGVIGVLNFFNAVFTSIITRRREFAMLRSIGMTTKQLQKMLVAEGVWYTVITLLFSLSVCAASGIFMGKILGTMFWFFDYQFTLLPFIIVIPVFILLGFILPYGLFHMAKKDSIVEQLRKLE